MTRVSVVAADQQGVQPSDPQGKVYIPTVARGIPLVGYEAQQYPTAESSRQQWFSYGD